MPGYCEYSQLDPLHKQYHDNEYGFPLRDDAALLERLALEINQAGLSWTLILKKKDAFHRAFEGFDPQRVAAYGPEDEARPAARCQHHPQPPQDPGRHRKRPPPFIAAPEYGSFAGWLDHHHPLARMSGSSCSNRPLCLPAAKWWANSCSYRLPARRARARLPDVPAHSGAQSALAGRRIVISLWIQPKTFEDPPLAERSCCSCLQSLRMKMLFPPPTAPGWPSRTGWMPGIRRRCSPGSGSTRRWPRRAIIGSAAPAPTAARTLCPFGASGWRNVSTLARGYLGQGAQPDGQSPVVVHLESGDETVIVEGTARAGTRLALARTHRAVSAAKYEGYNPEPNPDSEDVFYMVKPRGSWPGWSASSSPAPPAGGSTSHNSLIRKFLTMGIRKPASRLWGWGSLCGYLPRRGLPLPGSETR